MSQLSKVTSRLDDRYRERIISWPCDKPIRSKHEVLPCSWMISISSSEATRFYLDFYATKIAHHKASLLPTNNSVSHIVSEQHTCTFLKSMIFLKLCNRSPTENSHFLSPNWNYWKILKSWSPRNQEHNTFLQEPNGQGGEEGAINR